LWIVTVENREMAPNNRNAILLALVGSTALFVASKKMFFKSKSISAGALQEIDPDDCITAEEVGAIFDALFLHMQNVLAQLSQQIQQIQMSGQSIPEAQLMQLLKAEFERALLAKQKMIFEEYDVDEDCLKQATWEYLAREDEYPSVKKAVERFQRLYENISGEKVVGRRPGDGKASGENETMTPLLTKEQVLEAATIYFEALTSAMESVVKEFKNDNEDLGDKSTSQKLHMKFASVANDVGEAALEKMGVSLNGFQEAIKAYGQDPQVGQTLAMLQMKQQQDFMALGVPPPM